jgi:hypothetical protein
VSARQQPALVLRVLPAAVAGARRLRGSRGEAETTAASLLRELTELRGGRRV